MAYRAKAVEEKNIVPGNERRQGIYLIMFHLTMGAWCLRGCYQGVGTICVENSSVASVDVEAFVEPRDRSRTLSGECEVSISNYSRWRNNEVNSFKYVDYAAFA